MTKLNDLNITNSEILGEIVELFDSIPLLNWMSNRTIRAKDMPKDSSEKIIVNLAKPHMLEDTDYFRESALTYKKTGVYTDAFPSKAPSSPYRKFWDEEKRRCLEGYVRKSDGEWITGYHYFYLNYSPILRTEIIGERSKDGTVQAERITDFPDFWDGDYLFFHYVEQAEKAGKHGVTLKARGKGYSYKAASMCLRNYHLIKKSKSFALASDKDYLTLDGILNKVWDINSFIVDKVGFAKRLIITDSLQGMHKQAGYKKAGTSSEGGFLSEIIGVTLKNDPDKARGKRGKLILWEESGSFPHILKSWRLAQKSVESGNRVFGFMLAFGTGGEEGVNFEGLEELFYKPKAYSILRLSNIFDKTSEIGTCGMFIPDYLNREDCYDKDGNSDVVKAVYEVLVKRFEIKYSVSNPTDYAQTIAEEPFTPQEAVMRTEGTVFPVQEIKSYLARIEPTREFFVGPHYVGEILYTGMNNVEFRPRFDISPIRDYPMKGKDTTGAIEIFQLPKVLPGDTKPIWGRYIGGIDPVDDDIGTSLFSILIMDLFTDEIVAEYTGRENSADFNFEKSLKLALLYNAELNYENKLKGLFDYFKRMNALRYLADTPESLRDMDYVKTIHTTGNKSKGTPPSPNINKWGRRLQADWMSSARIETTELDKEEITLKLHSIRSIGYLKECSQWNINGNFDRISAGNMLFILRANKIKLAEGLKGSNSNRERDEYANDPFFMENYSSVEGFDI